MGVTSPAPAEPAPELPKGTGRPALQGLRPAAAAGRGIPAETSGGPSGGCRSILGALGTPLSPCRTSRIRNLHAIPQLRRTKGALQRRTGPGSPAEAPPVGSLGSPEEPGGSQLAAGSERAPRVCVSPTSTLQSILFSSRCPGLWSRRGRRGRRGLEPPRRGAGQPGRSHASRGVPGSRRRDRGAKVGPERSGSGGRGGCCGRAGPRSGRGQARVVLRRYFWLTVLFATRPPGARGAGRGGPAGRFTPGFTGPWHPAPPARPETTVRRWVRSPRGARGGGFPRRWGSCGCFARYADSPATQPLRVSWPGGRVGAR